MEQWKNKTKRKSLIIQGARQVGKTWIMRKFGPRFFSDTIYINFDNNETMKKVFEIDFFLQQEMQCIPIEVKAEENLRARSLRAFCDKYKVQTAIRSSMSNYRELDWMVNVPLYTRINYLDPITLRVEKGDI